MMSLVGRGEELAHLHRLVADVGRGRGAVVWLEGQPGIGKTALVDAALARCPTTVRIFRSTGDELLQVFALRLVATAMGVDRSDGDAARDDIAALLAGRRAGAIDPVEAAGGRLIDLIQDECARTPAIVVLDDLQWGDDASIALCRRLTGLIGQLPMLLTLVCRPIPLRENVETLRRIIGQEGGVVLGLTELSPVDVVSLAEATVAAPIGARLRAALEMAAGNPLYVREMLEVLLHDRLITVYDGVAELITGSDVALYSLSDVIGRHLSLLSTGARTNLRAASVLGLSFTGSDRPLVSSRSREEWDESITEAMAAGLLIETDTGWSFRHPLVWSVLHDELAVAVRVALHQHVALRLAAAGDRWERVAQHIVAAGPGLDPMLLDWLVQVPPQALCSQPALAADLLEWGRQATTVDDPRWPRLTTTLTTVLRLLHRQDDLLAVAEPAVQVQGDAQLLGETAWNLAIGLGLAGRFDELLSLLERVLNENLTAAPWCARLRAFTIPMLTYVGRPDEAAEQAQLAIAEAEEVGDPIAVGWTLHYLAGFSGNATKELAHLDRALEVVTADDPESVDLRLLVMIHRASVLSVLGRVTEAEHALRDLHIFAERAGSGRADQVKINSAEQSLHRGRWDDASVYLDQLEQVSDDTHLVFAHGMAAEIAARRGQRTDAQRHLAMIGHVSYQDPPLRIFAEHALNAEAVLAESDGDAACALGILKGWLDPRFGLWMDFNPQVFWNLVRLALTVGDRDTAETAAALATKDASIDADSADGPICQAMLNDDPDALHAAADQTRSLGHVLWEAFLRQEAAVRYADRGDLAAARADFTEAAQTYEEVGATWDLRLLQQRLRPYGIRRGPRSQHRRETQGWPALTPVEAEVARIVSLGSSNGEIATRMALSRRTVDTHVGHILRKLGVSSRVDIALEASAHE